jgi:hypothetical protein
VLNARENGATWNDIAQLLAIGPEEAHLRFDPESPIADGRWPIPDENQPPETDLRQEEP